VTDYGAGFSAEHADRPFNAFFTTRSSGMGMGLSICRSIMECTMAGCGRPRASRGVLSFSLRSPLTEPPSVIDVAWGHQTDLPTPERCLLLEARQKTSALKEYFAF
jgi:hypothetical protein